jgi:hypothetical protein
MPVINLTPHQLDIYVELGSAHLSRTLSIPPSGIVPRVGVSARPIGHVLVEGVEVPVTATSYGAVSDLPEPNPVNVYVVSRVVAEASPDRSDLLIPGEAVRDQAGRVIGCRGLCSLRGKA